MRLFSLNNFITFEALTFFNYMITHIEGRLVEKNPTDVVIDCNGMGYND